MSGIRFVALVVTAVCLSLSAGDAAIVPTEPLLVQQSGAKKKDKEKDKTIPSNCSPDRFPIKVPDDRPAVPLSCCQDGDRTYHTNDGKRLAIRVLGTPCTEADGKGTNCEGRRDDPHTCAYGPCGVKIELVVTGDQVFIFKPKKGPKKCGLEVREVSECSGGDCGDWPIGKTRSIPEPYDNLKHKLYGGLQPRCPFIKGCALGGKPIP
jgi:hypothetical protein